MTNSGGDPKNRLQKMFVGELAAVSALLAASLQLKSFSLTQTNTKVFQMIPLCPVYAKLVRGSGGLKFS